MSRLALMFTSIALALAAANAMLWLFDLGDCPVFRTDPRYGYIALPEQWVSTRGHRFHLNNYGLRGPDLAEHKAAGVARIAFLGDSVTFVGGVVSDKETFASLVAEQLNHHMLGGKKWEAVNISSPGWGITNIAGYVRAQGLHDADLLVWILPLEDFRRPKTNIYTFGHLATTKPIFRLLCVGRALFERLKGVAALNSPTQPGESEKTLSENLIAFRGVLLLAKAKRVRTVVFFMPRGATQPSADFVALGRYEQEARSAGAVICDLEREFAAHNVAQLFYDGVHLGQRGNEVIAGLIIECLDNSNQ